MDSNMMDVDYDINIDADPGMEPEPLQTEQPSQIMQTDNGDEPLPAAYTEDLFNEISPVPEALNLQGVDELGANGPIDWAMEHFSERPERLRWINDTSVNILYYDADAARKALIELTDPEAGDPSSLDPQTSRRARPYSLKPHLTLYIRQANTGDRKDRNAANRSDYYKRNPQARERAPRRNRREEETTPQLDYGDEDESGQRNGRRYKGRSFNGGLANIGRRSFGDNMYDDAPRARDSGRGRRNGTRDRNDRARSSQKDVDSYRPGSRSPRESRFGRLRGRSASPGSEEDGRYGFAEEGRVNRRYRSRSREDRRRRSFSRDRDYRSRRPALETERWEKDRFEDDGRWLKNGERHSNDVFPHKTDMSNHRRTDAHDETYSPLKGSILSRMTKDGKPLAAGRSLASRMTRDEPVKPSLLSRITRDNEETTHGRLKDDFSTPQGNDFEEPVITRRGRGRNNRRHSEDNGFSIRGTAPQHDGFAIRGSASGA